ncbi:hypothetical protein SAMN05660642_02301 [Geodermatophilus siccatus]|uniref:Uncharacterized protein n=1 Tax=Geodermatophilus siccatus TaxID=1137991 RepID=A0A1G9SPF6_9ACTN|nr:hypothetical protein SAMN05660642_02301 [Geodermatophilus siccatus]
MPPPCSDDAAHAVRPVQAAGQRTRVEVTAPVEGVPDGDEFVVR